MKQPTHIRFSDLPVDHPLPEIERCKIVGHQAMIARVRVARGCVVPSHRHENEQFAVVLSGHLRFTIGDPGGPGAERIDVRGGEVMHLPSNVPHAAEAIEDSLVLDIFSPPGEMGIDRLSDGS